MVTKSLIGKKVERFEELEVLTHVFVRVPLLIDGPIGSRRLWIGPTRGALNFLFEQSELKNVELSIERVDEHTGLVFLRIKNLSYVKCN